MRERLKPEARKADILEAAMCVARARTPHRVTLEATAETAGVSSSLVSHYFSTAKKLKRAVMRYAVQTEDLKLLAFGLVVGDHQALKAGTELQQRAREWRV